MQESGVSPPIHVSLSDFRQRAQLRIRVRCKPSGPNLSSYLLPSERCVRSEGSFPVSPRTPSPRGAILLPLPTGAHRGPQQDRQGGYPGEHQRAEGLAQRAPQEPLPHEGREDHAGNHHQDEPHAGVHVVCQRETKAEEGEPSELGL